MQSKEKTPLWKLIRKIVEHSKREWSYVEIIETIQQSNPNLKADSIRYEIIACTVNHASRVHYPEGKKKRIADPDNDYDFLFSLGKGTGLVKYYNPLTDGTWEIDEAPSGRLFIKQVNDITTLAFTTGIERSDLYLCFDRFSQFVEKQSGEKFNSFFNPFLAQEEGYKFDVHKKACERLSFGQWDISTIGDGRILKFVANAMDTPKNNLIFVQEKLKFKRITNNPILEQLLFDLYQNNVDESYIFESLKSQKIAYGVIAFLYFLKDKSRFLPLSPERIDKILIKIGIEGFTTKGNASWQNYLTYNQIASEVRDFLNYKLNQEVSLLDAHSFLWILSGNFFDQDFFDSIIDISEAEFQNGYAEGKAIKKHFQQEYRLRNSAVVNKAKANAQANDPELHCEACGFSFLKKYGKIGIDYIEAHHKMPFSQTEGEVQIKATDFNMLCSNCHRMIHRMMAQNKKVVSIQEFVDFIEGIVE